MKSKELLLIAISSFILTIIWITSNVYHAYATSTLDSLLQVQIQPISPDFDMDTIHKLLLRTPVLPQSIVVTPVPESPTPTPGVIIQESPIPTETPPQVASPTETPAAPATTTPTDTPTVTP